MKEGIWREKRKTIKKFKKENVLFHTHFHNIYHLGTALFYTCEYETHSFLHCSGMISWQLADVSSFMI